MWTDFDLKSVWQKRILPTWSMKELHVVSQKCTDVQMRHHVHNNLPLIKKFLATKMKFLLECIYHQQFTQGRLQHKVQGACTCVNLTHLSFVFTACTWHIK